MNAGADAAGRVATQAIRSTFSAFHQKEREKEAAFD